MPFRTVAGVLVEKLAFGGLGPPKAPRLLGGPSAPPFSHQLCSNFCYLYIFSGGDFRYFTYFYTPCLSIIKSMTRQVLKQKVLLFY